MAIRYLLDEHLNPAYRSQLVRRNPDRAIAWQIACNGVILHITPTSYYKELKPIAHSSYLAGIKLLSLTQVGLSLWSSKYPYEFSGLYFMSSDLIPLLWVNK